MRGLICLLAAGCVTAALAQDGSAKAAAGQENTAKADNAKADGAKAGDGMHPHIKMSTSLGDITLELDGEKAPITVDNFIQYVQDGFYKGLIFHRVMKNFMIQGGGYTPDLDEKKEGLRDPIKNEWRNGLKNKQYTIAMARTSVADSATAQFFINVVDNPSLDVPTPRGDNAAYCVFGKVIDGKDVVDKIRDSKVTASPKFPAQMGAVVPEEPVVIKDVQVVGLCDRQGIEKRVKAAEAEAKAATEAETKAMKELADSFKQTMDKMEDAEGRKVQTTPSGLMYVVIKEGDGASPKATDTVVAHYTGWTLDGHKFDSSHDHPGGKPAAFPLNRVIGGWTEGVGMMKVGGKRRLFIPGDLGYGPRGNPRAGIKPNATLVFDIELVDIK